MTTFKPGDRVRAVETGDKYDGLFGEVTTRFGADRCALGCYLVRLDGKKYELSFDKDELTRESKLLPPLGRVLRVSVEPGIYPAPTYADDRDEYVFTGDWSFEVEEVPATVYVQVKYTPYSAQYTYIDPSGTLAVGDDVVVPVWNDGEKIAKVVALGNSAYTGPCKTVTCRLVREAL